MKRIFINTMLVLFCLLATIALGKDSRYNTEDIPKLTIEYGLPYSSEMMNRSFSERCIVFSSIEEDLWDYEEKHNTAFMTNALEFARRGVPSAMKLLYIGYKDGTNSILPNELQALKWKGRYETATGTTLD